MRAFSEFLRFALGVALVAGAVGGTVVMSGDSPPPEGLPPCLVPGCWCHKFAAASWTPAFEVERSPGVVSREDALAGRRPR